jgi:hypothetical protein
VATRRKEFNPFYTIVVVVGTAFVLTAGAYWMETLSASGRLRTGRDAELARRQGPFSDGTGNGDSFLDTWGTRILVVELGILGVAAVSAMGLDRWRSSRPAPPRHSERSDPS